MSRVTCHRPRLRGIGALAALCVATVYAAQSGGCTPASSTAPPQTTDTDCNANGIPDVGDIATGRSRDCNLNGIPDECDVAAGTSTDVNTNGVSDECETDCNDNSVPDRWEITTGASPDCNDNGLPDECDIVGGTSRDADENGLPDECERDCNGNGRVDIDDLADGSSADCNGNLIPDECDLADGSSRDDDGDEIPDECAATAPCDETLANASFVSDTTVTAGCYQVDSTITVSDQAVLTIEPGVTLKFAPGRSLIVEPTGRLRALGTPDKPIVLTGQEPTRGFWKGVEFNDSNAIENRLEYVTIEYGGGAGTNIAANLSLTGGAARVELSHCTLRESGRYGFYFNAGADAPVFEGNTITRNTSGAGYLHPAAVGCLNNFTTQESTYGGNDLDAILVMDGATREDHTWPALADTDGPVDYLLAGHLRVEHHLTIAAGARLVFMADTGCTLSPEGALTALGTADQPILFSGQDAVAGSWDGLEFYDSDSAENRLQHVIVEYGGGEGSVLAANIMLVSNAPRLEITESTIRHSGGWGIWAARGALLNDDAGAANSFADNASGDLYRQP